MQKVVFVLLATLIGAQAHAEVIKCKSTQKQVFAELDLEQKKATISDEVLDIRLNIDKADVQVSESGKTRTTYHLEKNFRLVVAFSKNSKQGSARLYSYSDSMVPKAEDLMARLDSCVRR